MAVRDLVVGSAEVVVGLTRVGNLADRFVFAKEVKGLGEGHVLAQGSAGSDGIKVTEA